MTNTFSQYLRLNIRCAEGAPARLVLRERSARGGISGWTHDVPRAWRVACGETITHVVVDAKTAREM